MLGDARIERAEFEAARSRGEQIMLVTETLVSACPSDDINDIWGLLGAPQRVVYALNLAFGDIYNGGLAQFYGNSSGDVAQYVPWALDEIDAAPLASVFASANELFATQALPSREARLAQLNPETLQLLDRLDDDFHSLDERLNTWALMVAYVVRHETVFFQSL